ncbi:unnamed protein product [Arctogadus glacialis]
MMERSVRPRPPQIPPHSRQSGTGSGPLHRLLIKHTEKKGNSIRSESESERCLSPASTAKPPRRCVLCEPGGADVSVSRPA